MENTAENTRVLRLFGAQRLDIQRAAAAFPKEWQITVECRAKGGETLAALHAENKKSLDKAQRSLKACFPADLYAQGCEDLARSTVRALEEKGRLLVCADTTAAALVEPRLKGIAGAERISDFGTQSYAHARNSQKIEKIMAKRAGNVADIPTAICRVQAAVRVVGADLAAGCVELREEGQGNGMLLLLGTRRGVWMRAVLAADNPGLWLLDMIRRAALRLDQAEGTCWQKYGRPPKQTACALPECQAVELPAAQAKQPQPKVTPPAGTEQPAGENAWKLERNEPLDAPAKAPTATKKQGRLRKAMVRLLWLIILLAALAAVVAWYYTGGDLSALPGLLGLPGTEQLSLSGASLI